ncbi:MAG: hypothetical protein GC156_13740 [Actinomycetales bacterium]|nr:hypothetical protein [Actinomycetales bacterium]
MLDADVQQAMATVGRVSAVAAEHGTQEELGHEILSEVLKLIPFEAAELTTFNPLTGGVEEIAAVGYDDEVLEGLRSQRFLELMESLSLPDTGIPIRMKDLPGRLLDNWAVSELLLPAGYSEGMTMALRTPDGRFTGVLNLSTTSTEHPSDIARAAIAQLCSALGNLADPARSGRWLAMLLGAGSMAVGLDREGRPIPLPGMATHPLLGADTDLVQTAKSSAGKGGWNSFVWPDDEDWFRVRVVPCAGASHISTVVSLDNVDLGPLSRRELEVLTLAADGLSNSEIGDALVISSRTVGSHIEHVLEKLSVPNRAAAVALAIREGLMLGRVERHDLP